MYQINIVDDDLGSEILYLPAANKFTELVSESLEHISLEHIYVTRFYETHERLSSETIGILNTLFSHMVE